MLRNRIQRFHAPIRTIDVNPNDRAISRIFARLVSVAVYLPRRILLGFQALLAWVPTEKVRDGLFCYPGEASLQTDEP
uniref:Uncharacterized protein n=1 Tax=Candidatus Kentrum sp. LPFa TaxID=2126335 RepID=A0A450X2R1_9GAMM|nr:MAG: hypothetical protein BECKLPF1236C_GA0070990_1000635 [Candidatus Kentron sp. LPFa]